MFIKFTAKMNNVKREYIVCKEKVTAIRLSENDVYILFDNNAEMICSFNSKQEAENFFSYLSNFFDIK